MLDKLLTFMYTVKAVFSNLMDNPFDEIVRSVDQVPYLPAQEASAQQGARLPCTYAHQERPSRSGSPSSPWP